MPASGPERIADAASRLLRVVRNGRTGVDWNTCGQAAVATLLAAFRVPPFGLPTLTDGEAIDEVRRQFPPDVPFGLGTSPWRILAALRGFGVSAEHVHSGWLGRGATHSLTRLRDHVASGRPAVVCLDLGPLGGRPWTAHWAIVEAISADAIRLGNVANAESLDLPRFMCAWRCRHLPWGFNHAAILPGRW